MMHGLTIDHVFVERGMSGSKKLTDRPEVSSDCRASARPMKSVDLLVPTKSPGLSASSPSGAIREPKLPITPFFANRK